MGSILILSLGLLSLFLFIKNQKLKKKDKLKKLCTERWHTTGRYDKRESPFFVVEDQKHKYGVSGPELKDGACFNFGLTRGCVEEISHLMNLAYDIGKDGKRKQDISKGLDK